MTDVSVQLSQPILVENEEVTELTLREPTVKDMRAVGKIEDDMEQSIDMIGRLSGLAPSSLDQVKARDFVRLSAVVADFLDDGQETGESF